MSSHSTQASGTTGAGPGGSATQATSTPVLGTPGASTNWMPTKPIMGGITQVDSHTFAAWTGGLPKADWSGLDPLSPSSWVTPNQLRPASIGSSQKSHNYRRIGLAAKFAKGGDLDTFEHEVWTHLEDTGMHSIAYVPDAVDPTKMVNCVKEHARFTIESITTRIKPQVLMYDSYDKANDKAATAFLLDSLEKTLAKDVRDVIETTDPFPVVFMQLIKIIRSVSIDKFENMKAKIKSLKPHHYAGQDLTLLARDFRANAKELEIAGQYTHNLTLTMIKSFLEAGGKDNEDFRYKLRGLKEKLDEALLHIGYMSHADARKHMVKAKLTYQDICTVAVDEYRKQLDNGLWPPARGVPDSNVPPKSFGGVAMATNSNLPQFCHPDALAVAQAYALIQQHQQLKHTSSGRDKSNDECLNCGKKGHWSRNCPTKKKNKGIAKNRRSHAHQQRSSNTPQRSATSNWKKTPPKAGEPEVQQKDSKTWKWCAKCNRWSTTHGTAQHIKPVEANLVLLDSPAAWCFPILAPTVSLHYLWHLLVELLLHGVAASRHHTFRLLLTLGFGFSLGNASPELLQFIISAFSQHWTHIVAPAAWLLCLLISFFAPFINLYPSTDHPAPAFPVLLSPNRRKSAIRKRRLFQHSLRATPHHNASRHYGLTRKATSRLPLSHRDRDLVHHALEGLRQFAAAISFRRVRREGAYERSKKRTFQYHRRGRSKTCKHRYHTPDGLTYSNLQLLRSPIAKAYFMYAPLPDTVLCASAAIRAAFIAPLATNNVIGKEHRSPVIWDSGASMSISPHRNDFVGPLTSTSIGVRLQGISKGLVIKGTGYVAWSFVDATGVLRTLKTPCYYVPGATARLLSTTSLLQDMEKRGFPESISQDAHRLRLSGNKELGVNPIDILKDPRSNLHIGMSYDSSVPGVLSNAFSAIISKTSSCNINLNAAEKELLHWHCRLGHLSYKKIQFLMRTGVLAHSEAARRVQSAAGKLPQPPMCAACQYGKQRRRPAPGKRSHAVRDRDGILKRDNLYPGQRVSVDHFICSTKGRLEHTFGKEDDRLKYSGGCIFVDHASGFVFVSHQVHLDTHETIQSKDNFESYLRDYGIVVSEYLSDNGSAFTSQAYLEHLKKFSQISQFAGVGAHHHNGVAERSIQTIMSIARTMLLHAAIHWPNVADAALWPLAVAHAAHLYNSMPDPSNGLSPLDILTRTRQPQIKFQDLHVFGCPVYVLEKSIVDGKKLPRWKPRSTRMIYMGQSKKHASSVPLCLNPDTGAITSQYHVVFDDHFATVSATIDDLPDFGSDSWHRLFGDSEYQYILDDDEQAQVDAETVPDFPPIRQDRVSQALDTHRPSEPLPVVPPPLTPTSVSHNTTASPRATNPPALSPPGELLQAPSPPLSQQLPGPSPQHTTTSSTIQREPSSPMETTAHPPSTPLRHDPPSPVIDSGAISQPSADQRETKGAKQSTTLDDKNLPASTPANLPANTPMSPRRSTRLRNRPSRFGYDGTQGHGYMASPRPPTLFPVTTSDANTMTTNMSPARLDISTAWYPVSPAVFSTPEFAAYKARAMKDPDTLSFQDAMASPHREQWLQAAQEEISALEAKGTWTEVSMSDAKAKIIPGTWVFKIKRSPAGDIKKFKGRYCVRGDLEENKDALDTYAPVVAWSTVRLFLTMCLLLGWTTVSIDFSNAFVQSTLEHPVWIHIPRGFVSSKGPGTCLRLRKSLYGLSVSPSLWAKTCIAGFKKLGFVQSQFDECLLYRKGMIVVLYVDDAGIGAKNPDDIDQLIEDLRGLGFELKKEGSFSEFLGIKFDYKDDGSIEPTQKGLIKKILQATKMEDCKPNLLPASAPLPSDPEGLPMNEKWHYSSVLGMLLYLSTNTRCDIAFAVSHVARFSANPKQSHATAVKSIIRYLKRTENQGTIIRPTKKLDLDLYVDADFCGLFRSAPDHSVDSACSRTGFVIMLNGCPLIWKSQLQSSVTCSTLWRPNTMHCPMHCAFCSPSSAPLLKQLRRWIFHQNSARLSAPVPSKTIKELTCLPSIIASPIALAIS